MKRSTSLPYGQHTRYEVTAPSLLHFEPHILLTINSPRLLFPRLFLLPFPLGPHHQSLFLSLSPTPFTLLGFAFNPVSVTRSKKTDSSSGALIGDRALISLVNNTLEIYHINSPDTVTVPATATPSTPSSSSAKKEGKKKAKSAKAKKGVEDGADEDEEEEDEEEEEEEAVAIELIQSSRGELVLKQAVIDLHGHR